MGQVITNVIAGLAVFLSALTWWVDRRRGRRNEARQKELDQAQEAIKQRQLLLDEQMLAFAREIRRRADIRVTMVYSWFNTTKYTLTIRNAGQGPAIDVQVTIDGYLSDRTSWNLLRTKTDRLLSRFPNSPSHDSTQNRRNIPQTIEVDSPGFHEPVSLLLTWHESDNEEIQQKTLQLTPQRDQFSQD